jgi:hypothetical protein
VTRAAGDSAEDKTERDRHHLNAGCYLFEIKRELDKKRLLAGDRSVLESWGVFGGNTWDEFESLVDKSGIGDRAYELMADYVTDVIKKRSGGRRAIVCGPEDPFSDAATIITKEPRP